MLRGEDGRTVVGEMGMVRGGAGRRVGWEVGRCGCEKVWWRKWGRRVQRWSDHGYRWFVALGTSFGGSGVGLYVSTGYRCRGAFVRGGREQRRDAGSGVSCREMCVGRGE